jgi:hypothetical protein
MSLKSVYSFLHRIERSFYKCNQLFNWVKNKKVIKLWNLHETGSDFYDFLHHQFRQTDWPSMYFIMAGFHIEPEPMYRQSEISVTNLNKKFYNFFCPTLVHDKYRIQSVVLLQTIGGGGRLTSCTENSQRCQPNLFAVSCVELNALSIHVTNYSIELKIKKLLSYETCMKLAQISTIFFTTSSDRQTDRACIS